MSVTIKLRGNTEAYWQSANPVPADREVILSTDKGNFKVGDGATEWTSLGYWLPDDLTSVITIVAGLVGINTTNPQRTLHVVGPSGEVSIWPGVGNRDLLIFENNDNSNIGIVTPVGSKAGLKMYESGSSLFSGFIYDHPLDRMRFYVESDISAYLYNDKLQTSGIELSETTQAVPPVDSAILYTKDNGGKTQLCVKFSDGTETVLASQP